MEMNSCETGENQDSTSSIEQYEDCHVFHGESTHAKHLVPDVQDEEMLKCTNRAYEALHIDHVHLNERETVMNAFQVQNTPHSDREYNLTTLPPSSSCKCRSTIVKPFKCGLCWKAYGTICQLHDHLEYFHRETEMYVFVKLTQTAFPRYKSSSVATQTDTEIEQREGSVVGRVENEFVDYTEREVEFPHGEFLDSERELDGQEHSDGKAEEPWKTAESNNCSLKETDDLEVLDAQEDEPVKTEMFSTEVDSEVVNVVASKVSNAPDYVLVKTELSSTEVNQTFQNDNYNTSKERNENKAFPIEKKDANSERNEIVIDDLQTNSTTTLIDGDERYPFRCRYCTEKFSSFNLFLVHGKEAHSKQTFCKFCKKQYASRKGYVRHLKLHTNLESCRCDKCDKIYSSTFKLNLHIKEKHSDVKNVICKTCGEGFATASRLSTHRKICLDIKHPCSFENCDKTYRCRTDLKAHLLTHRGEFPFMCDVCGKGFIRRAGLKDHMFVHKGKRPRKCDQLLACTFEHCDKKYRNRASLKAHLLTHGGELPFVCDECGKGFTKRNSLDTHKLQKHSDERPFKCDQCPWAFQTKGGLSSHKKTHTVTQDQMLPCNVCGKTFSNKWNLEAHVRQHTGEKPFVCEICGAAFIHNVSRKNHMKVHKAAV